MTSRIRASMIACAVLIAGACGDATAPLPGTIQVTVTTTGGDHDADGYELFVGSEKRVISASNTVRVDGFAAGSHMIELKGVASNCTVIGDNPRAVAVEPGVVTSAIIEVTCDATGIALEFRTLASEAPIIGYTVRAAGRAFVAQPNGSVTVSGLAPGSHLVTVTTPEGCSVPGGTSFEVAVTHRTLTRVTVDVTCARNPNLIAFAIDTLINRAFSRWVAVTSGVEGALPTLLFEGYDPAWSPDGKKLAYSTTYCDYYYGYGCAGGVSIIDFGTGQTSAPGNFADGIEPSWSPDGGTIAFIEVSPNFNGILKLSGMDGPATAIPVDVIGARSPSWSPDGRRLVFECRFSQNNSDICLVGRDGTGFVRLTTDTAYQGSPEWSPDGRRLAFETWQAGEAWVILMNTDGTDTRQFVRGWDPSWSPDGSKLVFARNDGMFVVGIDGSFLTRVSTGRHNAPSWRP